MRNSIIEFQNRHEQAFEKHKSLSTAFMFFVAFLTFLISNCVALIRYPFVAALSKVRSSKNDLNPVKMVSAGSLDETICKFDSVILVFTSDL